MDAKQAQARNEAQQRRLEDLTFDNSKLRIENTRLRSEAAGGRMEAFEKEILAEELRGAKDAVAGMEQQLQRLHAENAALRDGNTLSLELATVSNQLRGALDAKAALGAALQARLACSRAETASLHAALRQAEEQAEGARAAAAMEVAEMGEVAKVAVASLHAALQHAEEQAEEGGIAAATAEAQMVALRMATATALEEAAARADEATQRLELVESGALRERELEILCDSWRTVLLRELRSAEAEAVSSSAELVRTSTALQKREDDLVLMIHQYDELQQEHTRQSDAIQAAADGSALHATRLAEELLQANELQANAETAASESAAALADARSALELREQQLNALVAEHDASSQTAEVARLREGCALAELREALQHRCGQILDFTRGLCELAAADKRGMTEHEARSRLFCLSALAYEELAISPVATEREVFTRRFAAFPRSDENVPARNVCVCVDGDIK